MKNNNYTFFLNQNQRKQRDTSVAENVVETWNGVETFHHKSNVRSADILYIQNLMNQIVSNCQKHWKNILNYVRK